MQGLRDAKKLFEIAAASDCMRSMHFLEQIMCRSRNEQCAAVHLGDSRGLHTTPNLLLPCGHVKEHIHKTDNRSETADSTDLRLQI